MADLLRVVIALGLLEAFQDTERLTRRLKYGALARDMLRPFKAERASSVVVNLRLPERLAMMVDVYAQDRYKPEPSAQRAHPGWNQGVL